MAGEIAGLHVAHCVIWSHLYRMQWTAEGSVFGTMSLWIVLFVYEISREPLNGFATNSHGRHNEFEGQGHQGQKHLLDLSAACVRFVFGKTFLASSLLFVWVMNYTSSLWYNATAGAAMWWHVSVVFRRCLHFSLVSRLTRYQPAWERTT